MKSNKRILFLIGAVLCISGCGDSGSQPSSPGSGTGNNCPAANASCLSAAGSSAIPTSSTSTIPLYIADSSTTGAYGYANEPLVSVTLCSPNHTSGSQCQVVSNILLDTGSAGLRVFASSIAPNVQLTQQTISTPSGTLNLAECAIFGSGADWGSIQNADVIMGGQTASNIPVQVIDINYASIPHGCAKQCPDTDPCTAGYNGILGVAPFVQDCGPNCNSTNDAVNQGTYFGCDGTGCYDGALGNCGSDQICMFTVATSAQVSNPIASFASYNNGVSISLPSVASSGSSAVTGTLTLGISSPTPSPPLAVYLMDPTGATDNNYLDFDTTFNGTTYGYQSTNSTTAFLDSGSNAFYFPSALTVCSDDPYFYCPSGTSSLSATIAGYDGSNSTSVSFSVANGDTLLNSSNSAFNNLGGPMSGSFDWGLPFFYNRTIYVGINGTSSYLNGSTVNGPFWAF